MTCSKKRACLLFNRAKVRCKYYYNIQNKHPVKTQTQLSVIYFCNRIKIETLPAIAAPCFCFLMRNVCLLGLN